MSVPECGPAIVGLYAELFVSLLLRVSCTVGVHLPKNMQSKERKSAGRGQPLRPLDPCRYRWASPLSCLPLPAMWN